MLNGLINRSANLLGNPHIHLPVAPLTTGSPEALYGVTSLRGWHGGHLLLSWRFREMTDSEVAVESGVKNL
ncbi:hypothetical protein, partial [Microvirga roseola]|uniref:hypothetical protein n=1 Tax=Microvirga roseola TaxID=2883126 RepID=UPI001E435F60